MTELKADSTNATASGRPKVNGWKAVFPPAQWVPTYEGRWLKDNLLAGITLGAYALPEGVAHASLAGLTPEGIYGYLLGGIGYALFGSFPPSCNWADFCNLADGWGLCRALGHGWVRRFRLVPVDESSKIHAHRLQLCL